MDYNKQVRDLHDLSTEVRGAAMVILGLVNQMDNSQTDTLYPDAMESALYGVRMHLERIAEDLDHLEDIEAEKKGQEMQKNAPKSHE